MSQDNGWKVTMHTYSPLCCACCRRSRMHGRTCRARVSRDSCHSPWVWISMNVRSKSSASSLTPLVRIVCTNLSTLLLFPLPYRWGKQLAIVRFAGAKPASRSCVHWRVGICLFCYIKKIGWIVPWYSSPARGQHSFFGHKMLGVTSPKLFTSGKTLVSLPPVMDLRKHGRNRIHSETIKSYSKLYDVCIFLCKRESNTETGLGGW